MIVCLVCPAQAGIISTTPAWTSTGVERGEKYGGSVAVAGDVNGDGYSDVVVSAYRHDNGESDEGTVYLYLGSSDGLLEMPDATLESNQQGAWFGFSVAPAGDVNGDGYGDVIVGAPLYDGRYLDEGCAFVFLGSAEGLIGTPAWYAFGGQQDAKFGNAVSTAGDVNGDGYDDVLVGAPLYDSLLVDEGRVCLYLGSEHGLSAEPARIIDGSKVFGALGFSVSTAGDVNADGFADVVVGAYRQYGAAENSGQAYVFCGSDSGLSLAPDWTGEGTIRDAQYGYAVAPAGDVNGDGFGDVMVGAPNYGSSIGTGSPDGRIYLYAGSELGLSSVPLYENTQGKGGKYGASLCTAGDVNGDGISDIVAGSALGNFAVGFLGSTEGPVPASKWYVTGTGYFGSSVCAAGDVNGDGLSDVIAGAPELSGMGRAYVYYGVKQTGSIGTDPSTIVPGPQPNCWFGRSVGSAGDVNGDGRGDVIAGAYLYDGESEDAGRAFLYLGSNPVSMEAPAWEASGKGTSEWFGWDVSGAGDVNGDGYSDVLVGAPRYGNGEFDEGAAYLYLGSPEGLARVPAWVGESDQEGAQFGFSVARTGDVNGDGFSDILVGAFRYDGGESDEGRAYLFYGSPRGVSSTAAWTAEGDKEEAWFGYAVDAAGDVNGDGFGDVIIGAPLYDNDAVDEGRVFIFFGSREGLSSSPDWSAGCDQPGARFGISVGGAGDVDGDGFGDVIIGADRYISGLESEGRVFVYKGGAVGMSVMPQWSVSGSQRDSEFGSAVGPAGDFNEDGFCDIYIGEPGYRFGMDDMRGCVSIYTGSPNGPASDAFWRSYGYIGSRYGCSVSAVPGMSGRGTIDLLVGAPRHRQVATSDGRFYRYARSEASFEYFVPRQMRVDGFTPIDASGISDSGDSFSLKATGGMPFGRRRTCLEWEVKPFSARFDGAGLKKSPPADPGPPDSAGAYRQEMTGIVTGLLSGEAYCWRVRQVHTSPYLPPRGPWVTRPGRTLDEPDVRIGLIPPDPQTLPMNLFLFQNYPNPFNPGTTIVYSISKDAYVDLGIFDVLGRRVKTFPETLNEAGRREAYWDGRNDRGDPSASGVYFVRIKTAGASASMKIVLVR